MPPNIPCSSDDGNAAVIIVSSLLPGDDLPTQSLCLDCAPAFFAAMLQSFTGVDVSDWLYSQLPQAPPTEGEGDDQAGEVEEAAPDPPQPTPLSGRTRRGSAGPATGAGAQAGPTATGSDTAASNG